MQKGSSKYFNKTSSKPTYKIVNYSQDGSGRDTYIQDSNGGFILPKSESNSRNFFGSFRSYERPTTASYLEKRSKSLLKKTSDGNIVINKDIFLRSQNFVSNKHICESRETFNYLKDQSQRLSTPKMRLLLSPSLSRKESLKSFVVTPGSQSTAATPGKQSPAAKPPSMYQSFNKLIRDASATSDLRKIDASAKKTKKRVKQTRIDYPPLHTNIAGSVLKAMRQSGGTWKDVPGHGN